MRLRTTMSAAVLAMAVAAGTARAQTAAPAPKEPPPLWDVQLGASFVGTSGNSDTSSVGADFALHRRWPVWTIESTATAIRSSDHGMRTAERYLAAFRDDRKLSDLVAFSNGVRVERDQFSGIDFRSLVDAGLSWALVRGAGWTLDGVTGIAWNHEQRVIGPDVDSPVGLLQAKSRVPFGTSGDTTQRVTYYPDFNHTSAYRAEAEVTAQAAMNKRLALKLAYLLRYSNDPVPGFLKTDNTATASVVVRWRSVEAAPAP